MRSSLSSLLLRAGIRAAMGGAYPRLEHAHFDGLQRARGWQEAERRIRAAISSQHHQVRVRSQGRGLKPRPRRIGSRVPITRTRRVRSTSRRRAAHGSTADARASAVHARATAVFGNRGAGPPRCGFPPPLIAMPPGSRMGPCPNGKELHDPRNGSRHVTH